MPTDGEKKKSGDFEISYSGGARNDNGGIVSWVSNVPLEIDRISLPIARVTPTVSMPKKYIINKTVTVLIWEDGEKTIVRRCKDDKFDKRLGFLTAFFQHYSGMSRNKANKFLANLEVEEIEEEIKDKKFKVGDRVRIRKDLVGGAFYGALHLNSGMAEYRGKEATIIKITEEGNYNLEEFDYYWSKEMLEPIKTKRPKEGK